MEALNTFFYSRGCFVFAGMTEELCLDAHLKVASRVARHSHPFL